MLYLITANAIEPELSLTSDQLIKTVKERVIPGLELLDRLEKEGKILGGGIIAGTRDGGFVIELDSNEELDRVLMNLPLWGTMRWTIAPLLSFEDRVKHFRDRVGG